MKFCAELLGNLGRSTEGEFCAEFEGCVDVAEAVSRILRALGVALDLEELLVTSEEGEPLKAGTTTCQVGRVRVVRLYRGG